MNTQTLKIGLYMADVGQIMVELNQDIQGCEWVCACEAVQGRLCLAQHCEKTMWRYWPQVKTLQETPQFVVFLNVVNLSSSCGELVIKLWWICGGYVVDMWWTCGGYVVDLWWTCGRFQ
jgi:hypothetical protein